MYEGWNMVEEFAIFFNLIRYKHHAPQLLINHELVLAARERAVEYVEDKAYYRGIPFDESVYFSPNIDDEVTANDVIEEWYSKSEKEYDYDNPTVTANNMNFLRIVSKTTSEFGCGQAKTRSVGSYTVCLFLPNYVPGNEKINIPEPSEDFDARKKYEHIRALVRSNGEHLESPLVNFSGN
ncbi:uncharacterized protein LOC141850247 isoform X2 [Brevipalpus obovatus]|uniref:uncharacterized protein LOC141850247 isoform X2 n=1 Tax=Brevipalpus obovatus TaxID=246614 RepID=UPI003D9DCF61